MYSNAMFTTHLFLMVYIVYSIKMVIFMGDGAIDIALPTLLTFWVLYSVDITIMNHPPVITIDSL